MKCKRLIIFFGLLFSVFFSSFLSSNTFASSVTCNSSFTDFTSEQSYDFISDCDLSSLDSSAVWYYFISFSSDSLIVNRNVNSYLCFSSSSISSSCSISNSSPSFVNFRVASNFVTFSPSFYGTTRFSYFRVSPNSGSLSYTGTLNFSTIIYDSLDSSACPPSPTGNLNITENGQFDVTNYATATVNVPQEISETPYDNKLDAIVQAIYVCAGTMLVIYFFYCIYRMIIKGVKV